MCHPTMAVLARRVVTGEGTFSFYSSLFSANPKPAIASIVQIERGSVVDPEELDGDEDADKRGRRGNSGGLDCSREMFVASSSTVEPDRHFGCDEIDESEGSDGGSENLDDDNDDSELKIFNGLCEENAVRRRDTSKTFRAKGVKKDEFGHPLVRETCRLIGLQREWNPKLEAELKHLLRTLDPPKVCAVLRSQADTRSAAHFFFWADRQWRYRHAPDVYYTILEILSKTKLCETSRRVMRLMIRRRIDRRPELFAFLMLSYSRAGKLRSAMRVLNLMQKDGCGPDILVCNTAIQVLVRANRLNKALKFFDRMQRVGIIPNVVTYNCLIKGFCNALRVPEALEMIRLMAANGCSPDKISYYTVVSFFCKEKRVPEIRELLDTMKRDCNLLPDQVTYNLLIHVLSKHGHADEALEFLRESKKRGFHVDKVEYSAVVHSFCLNGRMNEAKEIVTEMFSKGCLPDVVTYSAVVNGFCRIGKVDQARKMMDHMYKHGCKPNTVTYTSVLNGLCKIGGSLEAIEMLNKSGEDWWTPSLVTYSVVVHGLRREGRLAEACSLVLQMIRKGFFPTPVEINQLIHALCREGKPETAKTFMEECQSKGCTVNVVNFTTIIHGFCKKGDLESVLSLLDDMYLTNRHPDVVTYTVIVDALGKKGRFDEAAKLLQKMLQRGVVPTPVTYRIVIHRYCEKGNVEELLKLLDQMLLRLEFGTAYNQVIEKLCRFGRIDDAYNNLGRVLRTASRRDAETCNLLIKSCVDRGLSLQAYKVACRMFRRNMIPDASLCDSVSKKLFAEGHPVVAGKLMTKFIERGLQSPQSV